MKTRIFRSPAARFERNARLPFAACLLALLSLAAAAHAQVNRNHFDSDGPMRAPGFFDFISLGAPGEGDWRVITEFNPPSAPNAVSQVLAERPSGSIAVAVRRNVSMKDGSLSLGIKTIPGRGGIVFRMVDEKNYLAVLVDPVSGDARLIRSVAGRSSELARAAVKSDRQWAALAIQLEGPKIAVTWEGKPVFEAVDPVPAAGRAGIATAGPGIMTFDEFVIDPKDTPRP